MIRKPRPLRSCERSERYEGQSNFKHR
jgi:hypothetical protein